MEVIKLKCRLLSDLVLNDTPATEGKAQTLSFIPGNNFLGVAAKTLYDKEDDRTYTLFHSGEVRFGDANPSREGLRGVKVPAALFYPKLKSIETESYISYLTDQNSDEIRKKQLKQCREGFYTMDGTQGIRVKMDKSFYIKSAYDSAKRRARDEQMYGMEALREGSILYFSIELDEAALPYRDKLVNALVGKRHIGRSRTAQYGLVEISVEDYTEPQSSDERVEIDGEQCAVVYADSRLIFLDENGYPTFRPSAADLGFTDSEAEILWEYCQVRTFAYAPWNYKLRAFDCDRCGFEKGSVFVVRTSETGLRTRYVGRYNNEGFGRVIYNPHFLAGDSDPESPESGKSVFHFVENIPEELSSTDAVEPSDLNPEDQQLFDFLKQKSLRMKTEQTIYEKVNDFVEQYGPLFSSDNETFASQWGSIRALAMVAKDDDTLIDEIEGYLNHGVAKEKWEKRGRKTKLTYFLEENKGKNLRELVVNLSSMMGKYCSKQNK